MAFKGLDTFTDVVEILRDPAKYDSKLKELKQLIAQYTEAVEAVVALANVNDYTQNIKKREEESKTTLELAKQEALNIVLAAKQEAADKISTAQKEQDLAKSKLQELKYKQAELDQEEKRQIIEATALATFKVELDLREDVLTKAEKELQEKQDKLKAALA